MRLHEALRMVGPDWKLSGFHGWIDFDPDMRFSVEDVVYSDWEVMAPDGTIIRDIYERAEYCRAVETVEPLSFFGLMAQYPKEIFKFEVGSHWKTRGGSCVVVCTDDQFARYGGLFSPGFDLYTIVVRGKDAGWPLSLTPLGSASLNGDDLNDIVQPWEYISANAVVEEDPVSCCHRFVDTGFGKRYCAHNGCKAEEVWSAVNGWQEKR